MSFEDLQSATCHGYHTRRCLRDWDYVWERLKPSFRNSIGAEAQVDMFYNLIKKAPQHELKFRVLYTIREDEKPDEYKMMHSMKWLRRVITDHYDKQLRDKNRDKHHQ